ncbi:uncharacterized protein ANIA_06821 [Aspergillus nidulans FGSC A4]|uniref:Uncharacterized protein n=1 Tax=Emericella nidulans (strain FGSC A4 / ATCC 38163 / CBS 112.46 / NRRL 194 / M139) TaxID=227321 RepID=C8V2G0_EMENI|nr:hypothetical protein [Aspergillus nidulans FGSC A4]CBF71527.1 TPA: hypothetical protein ANIA_06821 [Aspergillus nidulans FGSC A4]
MTGMNTSVSAGWYSFTNLGPITTTFTPAPACTASNQVSIGYVDNFFTGVNVYAAYGVQCTSTVDYFDCIPTMTPEPTSTTAVPDDDIIWVDYGVYYSPGLYCPKGWKTVGMAGRDASSVLTSSGVLAPTATRSSRTRAATPTPYGDDYYDYYYDEYNLDPASVMKSMLEPKQTMALCCPDFMTVDSNGACYSIVSSYTATTGCHVVTGFNYEYSETTTTYTMTYTYSDDEGSETDVITRVGTYDVPTATETTVRTYTTNLDGEEKESMTAMYIMPVVTLLYHESDLENAAKETAAAKAKAEAEASETATNAANSLIGRNGNSVWEGVGSVVGIWMVAMALGGALVLPW